MILIIIAALGFLLAVIVALAEAIGERDWPRKTGWFAVGMAACLLIFLAAAA